MTSPDVIVCKGNKSSFRSLAIRARSLVRSRFALTVALRAKKLDLWASLYEYLKFLSVLNGDFITGVSLYYAWFHRKRLCFLRLRNLNVDEVNEKGDLSYPTPAQ